MLIREISGFDLLNSVYSMVLWGCNEVVYVITHHQTELGSLTL